MPGKIYRYLADDHERLDALLERAISDPDLNRSGQAARASSDNRGPLPVGTTTFQL